MAQSFIYRFVPIILNLSTLLLCCLVIFSGFNEGLTQVYWVKADLRDFKAPAKLESSQFLKDIGTVSGSDLVGSEATAANLGLPNWMGLSLLTQCDHFAGGRVECRKPSVRLEFNPGRNLGLDKTSASSGEKLREAKEARNRASRFISGSFIVSAFCALGAPIESFFSPALSAISSGIAALLLTAGTIGGTVVSKKLVDAVNDDLGAFNISGKLGIYTITLGFVGAFLMLDACVMYTISYRSQSGGSSGARVQARSVGGNGLLGGDGHKYVQVENQRGGGQAAAFDRDIEAPASPSGPGMQRRLDEDWAAPDEYSSGGASKTKGAPPSIPMMSLSGNKGTKDLNTAYEPYTSRQDRL
ncbi:MAGE-like protein 2 [Cladorrhinum samala]|uniref:MAGE-like protein 2 n=1 Tax=Cladorrhinum samala TaxID=585594 RepID=A0AAV9HLH5_9PEZI|nr:MAGE-like protein 2 [Cladorrhinum samala]